MNKQLRKLLVLTLVVATVLGAVRSASPAKAADKIVVTWFVGLGTGTQPNQIDVQNKVVEKFNASQDKIELKINIAANNQTAPDILSTLIASGDAPDIVGPVGFGGANSFSGQWLDLQPLVDSQKFDMSVFPDSLVNLYKSSEGLLGIPFEVYPGLLYVNKDLFDEAGLAYPPTKFGEKYTLDGKEMDWDYDTLALVAERLTVDANGKDATDKAFDPTKVEQFGFVHQWALLRSELSTFGGAEFYDAKTGKVTIPENWRAEAQWLSDGVWKGHFIPNATYSNSDLFKPSEFASGHVAMARVMLWYTCCLGDLKANWDLAVVPSYKGTYYAPADADTFRLLKSTKNPEAAFQVMAYLMGEAGGDLIAVHGAYPARPDLQAAAIKAKQEQYPSVKNWDIVPESLKYAPAPHHESDFPNYNKGMQRFNDFRTLLYGDTGAQMDVAKELDKLQADLQAIVDEVKK